MHCRGAIALLLTTLALAAQDPSAFAQQELRLREDAIAALAKFVQFANAQQIPTLATEAWGRRRDWYAARDEAVLGAPARRLGGGDSGTPQQREAVRAAWSQVAAELGVKHRDLGLLMVDAGELKNGAAHLRRCLRWLPDDAKAHEALGHEQFDGCYGSPEEVAFAHRYRTMHDRAKELAGQDCEPSPLPGTAAPAEVRAAALAVGGAQGGPWQIWTSSPNPQPVALQLANHALRAQAMLAFLLPDAESRRSTETDGRRVRWLLVLRSDVEWRQFFAKNPQLLRDRGGKVPIDPWLLFDAESGPAAVFWHPPNLDADHMIAHITMWSTAQRGNEGLGQGLVHAMTSLLAGTTLTWFGAEPPTSSGRGQPIQRDSRQWSKLIRQQIESGTDVPLVQVPRERLSSFRETVRVKSWSFMLWLIARHPETWIKALARIDSNSLPSPDQVDAALQAAIGRGAAELEAEWRAFMRGDSALYRSLLPPR